MLLFHLHTQRSKNVEDFVLITMLNGWIKIPRNVLEWEWWDKPEMVVLYLYMLASANEDDTLWHSKEIKRGQLFSNNNL